jgi:hypothetical protein
MNFPEKADFPALFLSTTGRRNKSQFHHLSNAFIFLLIISCCWQTSFLWKWFIPWVIWNHLPFKPIGFLFFWDSVSYFSLYWYFVLNFIPHWILPQNNWDFSYLIFFSHDWVFRWLSLEERLHLLFGVLCPLSGCISQGRGKINSSLIWDALKETDYNFFFFFWKFSESFLYPWFLKFQKNDD